jgi:hypothetical protein
MELKEIQKSRVKYETGKYRTEREIKGKINIKICKKENRKVKNNFKKGGWKNESQ